MVNRPPRRRIAGGGGRDSLVDTTRQEGTTMIRAGDSIVNPVTGERLVFGLTADGKTNRKGMPSPLRLAVIANHHFDVVRLPVIPHVLQKAALVPGSILGRAVGFRPTYEAAVA